MSTHDRKRFIVAWDVGEQEVTPRVCVSDIGDCSSSTSARLPMRSGGGFASTRRTQSCSGSA
jgi:hypothetical protein